MSDSKVSDSDRQAYDGRGDYNPSGRSAAAMSAAKSAGAGSSVVSMDGSRGSTDKSAKAQSEIKPGEGPDSSVDKVPNKLTDRKPVPESQQHGSPELGNTNSVNDRAQ